MSADLSTAISSTEKMTASREFTKALSTMDLELENNPNPDTNADNDDRSVNSYHSHASTKAPGLDINAADRTRHRKITNVSVLKNSGNSCIRSSPTNALMFIQQTSRAYYSFSSHSLAQLVLAALCCVATCLVVVTYYLLEQGEQIEFETAFKIYAREIDLIVNMKSENVFGQLQSLATSFKFSKQDHGNTSLSPHQISIPDFDFRAEDISNLTGLEMLLFAPFVPYQEREAFIEFQQANQQWTTQGLVRSTS